MRRNRYAQIGRTALSLVLSVVLSTSGLMPAVAALAEEIGEPETTESLIEAADESEDIDESDAEQDETVIETEVSEGDGEEAVAEDSSAETIDSAVTDSEFSTGASSLTDEFIGTSWRYLNGVPRSSLTSTLSSSSLISWSKDGSDYVGSNGVRVQGATGFGIDVSEHQGTIDWAKVKAAGVDFVILRCGWGRGGVDKTFTQNLQGCIENDIPFGVYVYSYEWDYDSAKRSAQYVVSLLKENGVDPADLALPVFYDLENEDKSTGKPAGIDDNNQLRYIEGASTFANIAKGFAEVLEANGYEVGIYANRNWFTNYLTDSYFDTLPRWVADYTGTGSSKYTGEYSWWQCMSTGTVNGISGDVDINFSYEDEPLSAAELAELHRDDLPDGTYTICVSNSSSAVLDVRGGSLSAGAQVNLWKRSATSDHQLWVVSHDEAGFVMIQSVTSGLYLGVTSASSGSKLAQLEENDSLTQRWIAVKSGSTYSLLSSADTSLVLDAQGAKTSNGTRTELYTYSGNANQRWIFTSTLPFEERIETLAESHVSDLADGSYAFEPMHATSLCLDVQGASNSSGAKVNLWSYGGRSNQVWVVSHDSDGFVTLTNLSSGKVLDASGSTIRQATADKNSPYQKWIVIKSGSSIKFVSASNDSLVLDVRRAGKTNGTETILYSDSGASNQQWKAVEISEARASLNDLAYEHKSDLSDGTYYVKVSNSSSAVLDVQGASTSNSAFVNLWQKSGGENQIWKVSHDSQGYVTLTNLNSNKVLDVRGANASNGSRIIQYASNNGWNQKWIAVKTGTAYKLVSAMNKNLVLDAKRASTSNGTWTELYSDNNSSNQKWVFEKCSTNELMMISKAQSYSSSTKWLVLVDTRNNYFGVFTGKKGNWNLKYYWQCSTGASSTPTVIGQFTVKAKGYSFGSGYTCYYYTQFYGDYLIHSIKYYQGTFTVMDGRLGMNISHGCVRLPLNQAKWIYNNIPTGTKVVTYK